MATLTLTSNGQSITLIISPSDALEILQKFQNKYPNAQKTNLSLNEFITKWTR